MRNGLRMSELVEIAEGRRRRDPETPRSVRFCTSCGELAEGAGRLRVCPGCGMGVLLTAAPDALPGPRAPFVLVDRDLLITAVSSVGERVFGSDAAGRPLPSVVSARGGSGEISRQVARAASGLSGTARLEVSVAGRRGTFEARISPCGPPRAALLAVSRAGA